MLREALGLHFGMFSLGLLNFRYFMINKIASTIQNNEKIMSAINSIGLSVKNSITVYVYNVLDLLNTQLFNI
jgi:hypothetical protein